jgi:hypothetical protein
VVVGTYATDYGTHFVDLCLKLLVMVYVLVVDLICVWDTIELWVYFYVVVYFCFVGG